MEKKKKKRNKSIEEKRNVLLEKILDKWVYYKSDENFIFLKHKKENENSTTRLIQVVLSDNPLYDGVYSIKDYDIGMAYDAKEKKELVSLKLNDFDQIIGPDAERVVTKNQEELKENMIGAKHLTKEEFYLYNQSKQKPPGIERIIFKL